MNHKENPKKLKLDFRVSPEEKKLVQLAARREEEAVSEYLRKVVLAIVESSIESRDLLRSIPDNERDNAVTVLRNLIIDDKETTANSIKGAYEGLMDRLDQLEKLIGIFIYVFLYHSPEVIDAKKKQAKESAIERMKKALALIDDKQMQSILLRTQNDE